MPSSAEINPLIALYNAGRFAELENRARLLVDQFTDFGFGWKLLGGALQMQGKNALAAFQKVAELMPDDAEAHYNLGVALKSCGLLKEAEASYRRALAINPDYADAYSNLGNVLKELGQTDNAVASYRRAVKINPDSVKALNNLAKLLLSRGEARESMSLIIHSLQVEDKREARNLFVNCVKRCKFNYVEDSVRNAMIRALTEPWCRPATLANVASNMVKLNPDVDGCTVRAAAAWPQRLSSQELYGAGGIVAVSEDVLLRCLLESAPVWNHDMERFLTLARYTLLVAAMERNPSEVLEKNILDFYSALAQQCFINEYVFAWTGVEVEQARELRDALAAALEANAPIPELWPLAVACYFPLSDIPFAGRLPARKWPKAVEAVLAQQVREPELERQLRAGIPRLTAIDDEVSLLVQKQYEENPYPRWIKAEPPGEPEKIDGLLGRKSVLDILVAGCGSGQHPIGVAQSNPNAKVLAIDLSMSSLAYAKRKSRELGLDRIEYAQADIMKLGALSRSFDIIDSSGVLHHLAEPLAGWQVLLSLLRPGGLMRIGLYSKLARRGIFEAREFIAKQGYGSTPDDIRQCRQELLNQDNGANLEVVLKSKDFFSTSSCRDLLFHVQEHCTTLADIDAFLRKNDLRFLRFICKPSVVQSYKLRFPGDPDGTNLDNWRMFENEKPDTFVGMYQFVIQKPALTA
jgi:Flp pilus assembly protein TadD/SAM-dependent methyltransferase